MIARDEAYITDLEVEVHALRQRAVRAHQICNLARVTYPEIGELADDGCLHEAIHDILRVDHAQRAAPAACTNCDGHGMIGYTSGQTPEQFEQGVYPCPECAEVVTVAADTPAPQVGEVLEDAAHYRRLFLAAVEMLTKISLRLGVEPNDEGVEPVLAAIDALAAGRPGAQEPEWFELVIRDVCELEPEDPDAADTVCIRALDLRLIMERHAAPPAQGIDLWPLVRQYIAARDQYEQATSPPNSHAPARKLPHGSPITRNWVDARAALREAVNDGQRDDHG